MKLAKRFIVFKEDVIEECKVLEPDRAAKWLANYFLGVDISRVTLDDMYPNVNGIHIKKGDKGRIVRCPPWLYTFIRKALWGDDREYPLSHCHPNFTYMYSPVRSKHGKSSD